MKRIESVTGQVHTLDLTKLGTRSTVPILGQKEPRKSVIYEVGGKLAVKNLHAMAMEVRHGLNAGFKKRDLLAFIGEDKLGRIFVLPVFCARYHADNQDVIDEIMDHARWLKKAQRDNDMVFLRVEDRQSRTYKIGVLDQPKRVVHGQVTNRKQRRAMGVS